MDVCEVSDANVLPVTPQRSPFEDDCVTFTANDARSKTETISFLKVSGLRIRFDDRIESIVPFERTIYIGIGGKELSAIFVTSQHGSSESEYCRLRLLDWEYSSISYSLQEEVVTVKGVVIGAKIYLII